MMVVMEPKQMELLTIIFFKKKGITDKVNDKQCILLSKYRTSDADFPENACILSSQPLKNKCLSLQTTDQNKPITP